ncbi:hypothetical protein [Desulfotruncus arcticus]|uniref:hypothetical protein n=1 Tax=Desulfotruncus arcticus TaxID=341036 RepID=UPI0013F4F719|nr:hypothetical protein [Desulfotruncus arcticus]
MLHYFPEDMLQNKFSARKWQQHQEFPGGAFTDTGVQDWWDCATFSAPLKVCRPMAGR